MERWRVGILVFDGVAALDVAGPFEVFSRARLEPGVESRHSEASALFDVFTVGKTKEPVTATGGLVLLPSWSFADAPAIDLLLVPGGFGTRPLLQDAETIDWIRSAAASARRTASVCTGALLLGARGAARRPSGHDPLGRLRPAGLARQGPARRPRGALRRRRRAHVGGRRLGDGPGVPRRRDALRAVRRGRDGPLPRVPPRLAMQRDGRLEDRR